MLKTIKVLLKVKFTILLFVFLPLMAFTIITSKTDLLAGIKSYVVLTGSMEPTVPVGSVAFVKPDRTYQPNDVIAFHKGDVVVTHRVMERVYKDDGLYYRTQGDANKTPNTDLVAQKDVIGKGTFQIWHLGKLILYARTMQGFLALVIAPTLLFVALEVWNIKKEIEKETERKVIGRLQRDGLWQSAT